MAFNEGIASMPSIMVSKHSRNATHAQLSDNANFLFDLRIITDILGKMVLTHFIFFPIRDRKSWLSDVDKN